MATIYEERYNYHPDDFKSYDTNRIRKEFLVEKIIYFSRNTELVG